MRRLQIPFIAILFALSTTLLAATAPDFSLPTTNGDINLEQLKGKLVYLDFWASWCQPCKKSFPWMQQIKQKYGPQGLEIVAINLDKDRRLAEAFLRGMKVNFIVAFDAEGRSAILYRLNGMPGSYLIGRDGSLYASHVGFREKDKATLEKLIRSHLSNKPVTIK